MRLVTVPAGTPFGFKALPTWQPAEPGNSGQQHPSPVNTKAEDWAAIYPQLSLQSALAYLPNQWDRGHDTCCIVTLTTKTEIPVLLLEDIRMRDPHLPSSTKASKIRQEFHDWSGSLLPSGPLMDCFGSMGYCLCIYDSEDFELVVPHSLFFSTDHFEQQGLYRFSRHAQLPSTTGRVVEVDLDHRVVRDPVQLAAALVQHLGEDKASCTILRGLLCIPE